MAVGSVSGRSESCQRAEELLALAGEKTIGGEACDGSHSARKLITQRTNDRVSDPGDRTDRARMTRRTR